MRIGRRSVAVLTAAFTASVLGSPMAVFAGDEPTPQTAVAANSLMPLALPSTQTSCDELGNAVSSGEAWPVGVAVTVPFCVNALPIQGPPWTAWGGSSTADLQQAILNPNNPALVLPADVPAAFSNGAQSALASAVNSYQGEIIDLPMSDAFLDAGVDSAFHIVAVGRFALEIARLTPLSRAACGPANATRGCLVGVFLPISASVTPAAASKVYGSADPVLTGTLSGFLTSDGVTATYSRSLGETVAGSPYVISATLGPSGVLANYTITYNSADFIITKAPLSVTADDVTRLLGAAMPPFTVTYSGFVLAETPAVLGGSLAVSPTTAVNETVPSTFALRPGGLTSPNYALTFVDGRLTTKYAICPLSDLSKPANGASLPIKLFPCNTAGTNLSKAAVTLTPIEIDRAGAKVATASGPFTFSSKLGDGGGYQYNVSTKGLTAGQKITYTLVFRVSSDMPGVLQTVNFILK